MTSWEPVIGLEIHIQLLTRSKIFSGASTAYGAEPNTQACALDLGMPGTLPVLNAEAVAMAVKFGLAVGAEISPVSVFARKNYFYPDLPKGYQISQYDRPIVSGGSLEIDLPDGGSRRIGITRAHLEEDAGKSLHEGFEGMTAVDLNRSGTPLLEIVSEPELRSAAEAVAYMKKLHTLVRYLEICDGNMQEGSFRCDANVSVRRGPDAPFGTRAEIKNVNSFRFVEKAIEHEIERQAALLESGGTVIQETRLYDPGKGETRSMRGKEEAHDYRYFPEPDLLPLAVEEAMIDAVRDTLPELPDARKHRFMEEYGLSAYDAKLLTGERAMADYFEAVAAAAKPAPAKLCANWVAGELSGALNKSGTAVGENPVTPERLAGLILRIHDGTVSGRAAKEVFEAMWEGEGDADAVIEARGLKQISDASALEPVVDEVMKNFPDQLAQYRGGKENLFNFFVGQVMKATRGKANPDQVNEVLKQKLGNGE